MVGEGGVSAGPPGQHLGLCFSFANPRCAVELYVLSPRSAKLVIDGTGQVETVREVTNARKFTPLVPGSELNLEVGL